MLFYSSLNVLNARDHLKIILTSLKKELCIKLLQIIHIPKLDFFSFLNESLYTVALQIIFKRKKDLMVNFFIPYPLSITLFKPKPFEDIQI